MKKAGIIGTGNMGGMLTEVLIESGAVPEENVVIVNRNKERSHSFLNKFPQLSIAESISDLINRTDTIFICVRPPHYETIYDDLKNHLTADHLLATITSPVKLSDLERLPPRRIVRTVPSIVNKTTQGPLLLTFGSKWSEEEKFSFREWISLFSEPVEIDDTTLRVSSDIVSCGPAFMSYLLERLIYAAVSETAISFDDAETLAEKMMISYGRLLQQGHYDLRSLREKVNVPGGITGKGLGVLSKYGEGMFEDVFRETHRKFAADQHEMQQIFQKKAQK